MMKCPKHPEEELVMLFTGWSTCDACAGKKRGGGTGNGGSPLSRFHLNGLKTEYLRDIQKILNPSIPRTRWICINGQIVQQEDESQIFQAVNKLIADREKLASWSSIAK